MKFRVFASSIFLCALFVSIVWTTPSQGVVAAAQIDVTYAEPNIARQGNIFALGGTLTNTGDVALTNLGVRVFSSDSINTRSTLNAQVSATDDESSMRDTGIRLEIGSLPSGNQTSWSMIQLADELFTRGEGVYVLGFQFETDSTRLDFKKIAVPYIENVDEEIVPVGISLLWPVASSIKTDWNDALPNEELAESVLGGGRLANILRAGQLNLVNWVVDPALVEFLSEAGDGYLVKDAAGSLVEGEYSEELNLFFNGLQASAQNSEIWALPYANSDISSLSRYGAKSAFEQVLGIAKPVAENRLGVPVKGVISLFPNGSIPSDVIGEANDFGLTVALVEDSKYPPIVGTLFTPPGMAEVNTKNGRKRILLADSILGGFFDFSVNSQEDRVLLRQNILADTFLLANQVNDPNRVIVVAPDTYWSPNLDTSRVLARSLTRAPWIKPVLLSDFFAQEESNVLRSEYQFSNNDLMEEISETQINSVKRTQGVLAELAAIYTDPEPIDRYARSILQATSSSFRTNQKAGDIYLDSIEKFLLENKSKVQILAQGSVVLPGDEGPIPITIANNLDQRILVRLAATSNPEIRFSAEDLGFIEIEPGAKKGLTLESKIVGAGVTEVELQLLTPEGDAFGNPVIISVQSAAYSRVATWIAGVAFVALILLSINSFRKRRKENV